MTRNANTIRKTLLMVVAALGLTIAANGHAAVVLWNPQSTDVAQSDFNTATMTFAGFTANQLDSVTGGSGSGAWWHSHTGLLMTAALDLMLDGIWTNIFSSGTTSVTQIASNTVTSIPTIGFASSTVTGIRLTGTPAQNQSFHAWATSRHHSPVTFTFSSVPEPGTAALLGLGLALAGAGAARKRTRSGDS